MPGGLVPAELRIGDLALEVEPSHLIEEEALGPTGPLSLDIGDWAGGLLLVEQGDKWQNTPQYLSARLDAAFPGQVICLPQANTVSVASGQTLGNFAGGMPVKQIDFTPSGGSANAFMVMQDNVPSAGRYVWRLSGSDPTAPGFGWTQADDLGGGNRGFDIAVSDNRIGVAAGTFYRHSADGAAWTNVATGAHVFAQLGPQLWRGVRPNLLYSTLGGFTGTWSSSNSVGDASYDLNSLVGVEQLLMAGKKDGAYTLDGQGASIQMTPETRLMAFADMASIRAATTFNGDYYFKTDYGIIKIGVDGTKERVGIDQLSTPDLPTPRVRALASDDRFLYALLDNTSGDLYILRRALTGAWHVFYWESGAGRGTHLAVSGSFGYPVLWFSYISGATLTTKYIRLSVFPNPLQDTNYRYNTAGSQYIRLPRIMRPDAQGILDQVVVQGRQIAAGQTIEVRIAVDGGAQTSIGTFNTGTEVNHTFSPSSPLTGSYFDVYIYLSTNATTASPVLQAVQLRGRWRGGRRFRHTYTVVGDQWVETRRGGKVRKPPSELFSDLSTLRANNTYQSCVDEFGAAFSALVSDVARVTQKESRFKTPDGQSLHHQLRVVLEEQPS